MRFFVLLGRSPQGPLSADDIRRLPGLSPDTPVCPEDRDPLQVGNWTAAFSSPELFPRPRAAAPDVDGGASRYWQSALAKQRVAEAYAAAKKPAPEPGSAWPWLLALAPILGLVLLSLGRTPPRPAPSPSPREPTVIEQAAPLLLPACIPDPEAAELCGRASVTTAPGRRQIRLRADGRRLKVDALFSFDTERQELKPLNDAARGLADIRRGCRTP